MNDILVGSFYQLCMAGNLDTIIHTFGHTPNTERIDMNYAYYLTYYNYRNNDSDTSPVLKWLRNLDSNIDSDQIENDYMADTYIPNEALLLACELGQFTVVEWLFNQEPYLSSLKNRCEISSAFIASCKQDNLQLTKLVFQQLDTYISTRLIILNQAYQNARDNLNIQTMAWLLEINNNIVIEN